MFRYRHGRAVAAATAFAILIVPAVMAQQRPVQVVLGFSRDKVPVYRIVDNDKLTYLGVQPADRYQIKDLTVLGETADGFYVLELGGSRYAFDPSDLRINRTVICETITPPSGGSKSRWSQGVGEQCVKR